MPHPLSRADRPRDDRRPARSALGPYETAYDVRRGYDQPLRERAPRPGELVFFRARDDDGPASRP